MCTEVNLADEAARLRGKTCSSDRHVHSYTVLAAPQQFKMLRKHTGAALSKPVIFVGCTIAHLRHLEFCQQRR